LPQGVKQLDWTGGFFPPPEQLSSQVSQSPRSRGGPNQTIGYQPHRCYSLLEQPGAHDPGQSFFFSERRGHATALGDGGAPTALLLVALGNRSRVEGVKHLESLTIEMPGHSHLDVIRYRRGFCRHYEHNEGFDDEKAAEAQCQVVLDVFKRLKHLALLFPGSREMSKYELIEYRDSKYETLQLLESATDLESLELEVDEGKRVLADNRGP
jgi:hypothetical protein